MNEDLELESAVRTALEENAGLGEAGLRAVLEAAERETKRRRVGRLLWRWAAPALLAASCAVALALGSLVWGERPGAAADGVADAICLLCELDEIPFVDSTDVSPGEMLLAWQEAPCADLL